MCGIFGIFFPDSGQGFDARKTRRMLDYLFTVSQSRGQEAAGLMIRSGDDVLIHKATLSGREFIRQPFYKGFFAEPGFWDRHVANDGFMAIGHARLDTNGSKWDNANNAPLEYENLIGVHNGIITNVDALWARNPHLARHVTVDSEVILALYDEQLRHQDAMAALENVLKQIEGSASVAIFDRTRKTVALGTNTGSLYVADYANELFVFASEAYILRSFHEKMRFLHGLKPYALRQVLPGTVMIYDVQRHHHGAYQGRLVSEVL
ncbi:MAG: hypothetical protein EP312_05605 [Gammaproteobacteria bacterium]|nr:MAG: hypothetical protein EP312_05605 [Gammaproteobacteria bacterium]